MKKIFVYKVWSKVLGVEEFESIGSFSKLFRLIVLSPRKTFYEKNFFSISLWKTWPKVIEDEESESEVSLFNIHFLTIFYEKNAKKIFFRFFLKILTEDNRGWEIRIRGQFINVYHLIFFYYYLIIFECFWKKFAEMLFSKLNSNLRSVFSLIPILRNFLLCLIITCQELRVVNDRVRRITTKNN
jgi:hypothetical protein